MSSVRIPRLPPGPLLLGVLAATIAPLAFQAVRRTLRKLGTGSQRIQPNDAVNKPDSSREAEHKSERRAASPQAGPEVEAAQTSEVVGKEAPPKPRKPRKPTQRKEPKADQPQNPKRTGR